MKTLFSLAFFMPLFLQAQPARIHTAISENPVNQPVKRDPGVTWVDNLNWQQVRKKAKKEHKYIFIDCFTTWCGPCKKMDKDVYINDSVGAFINDKFISVKVQMDSTNGDNAFTQSWYKTAKEMGATYRIAAYPTFLFFSPDGEIVYKDFGYKMSALFMQTAQDALNPSKQYYGLLNAYKKGKKDFVHMPYLITMSKQLGDTANYLPLLTDYYSWLQSLGKDKLYTKENIAFIGSTLESSKQSPFALFYPDGTAIDKVMKKEGYAKKVVDHVIKKEKANPFLSAAEGKPEPDWAVLKNDIAKDYKGDYADRIVLECKMKWNQYYGNAYQYTILLNHKMEKYGSDTTSMTEDFKLNNQAFSLWKEVEDTVQLKKIIGWMEGIVRRGENATGFYTQYWPYYIDTYANLLYKVGESCKAVQWQELAVKKGIALELDKSAIEGLKGNLEKMEQGMPTWLPDTK